MFFWCSHSTKTNSLWGCIHRSPILFLLFFFIINELYFNNHFIYFSCEKRWCSFRLYINYIISFCVKYPFARFNVTTGWQKLIKWHFKYWIDSAGTFTLRIPEMFRIWRNHFPIKLIRFIESLNNVTLRVPHHPLVRTLASRDIVLTLCLLPPLMSHRTSCNMEET